MLVSIFIRTMNGARYLGELLEGIASQETQGLDVETVLIDSGSTDDTLAIAEKHGCVITHITREEFSFGRSLNLGCEAAQGEVLILISGHCVPRDRHWLRALFHPLITGLFAYSKGKKTGGPESGNGECRSFPKYSPGSSALRQEGSF